MYQTFNYLKDMTNEQLKSCLLNDMESLRDGGWVPDDDSVASPPGRRRRTGTAHVYFFSALSCKLPAGHGGYCGWGQFPVAGAAVFPGSVF